MSKTAAPRRLGLLTGGGDCPGLNAVIRAVAKDAMYHGIEVVGIQDGFLGLIEDRVHPLGYLDVSGILSLGGTILGSSNRANPVRFAVGTNADGSVKFANVVDRCEATIARHGIDALVVIGGDGTMTCAQPFVERGLAVVGVPKTIDNDLVGTDRTFGFLTAVQTATDALDRVHTTAASHHRALVVEVMGRNAGWIALYSGVASGSDVVLLPEIPFDVGVVAERVQRRNRRGRGYTVICVSEGARPTGGAQFVARHDPTSPDPIRLGGVGAWLSGELERMTGIESRHVVLGHVQRGGSPIAADRVLGTRFGHHAMTLLRSGVGGRMVAMQEGKLTDVPMDLPAGKQRLVPMDEPLLDAARSVFTSFGVEA